MESQIEKEKLVKHWLESADNDYKTMLDLFGTKNYHWALFMGHLVIEKSLKALCVSKVGEFPPMIHDLRRIAEKAGLELSSEKVNSLDAITRFNINARYDDYKQSFFKLCTEDFTNRWIQNITDTKEWIKQQF